MQKKRRDSKTIPILSSEEIDEICKKAKSARDSCLIALLYLSGRRISEVLPLQKKDFKMVGNSVYFTTFNEKSYRKVKKGEFQIPRYVKFKDYEGIVYYEKITPRFLKTSVSGRILAHYILDYLEGLKPNDYLFKPHRRIRESERPYISRNRAYQILKELDERLWLHALRHIAFTRLAQIYRDDPERMHRVTFHRQFKSTLEYIHREEEEDRLELF